MGDVLVEVGARPSGGLITMYWRPYLGALIGCDRGADWDMSMSRQATFDPVRV